MIVIIAFFGGIRTDHLLLALFMLSFCTMTYGWVNDELSRPDEESRDEQGRATQWKIGSDEESRDKQGRATQWKIGSSKTLPNKCIPSIRYSLVRLFPYMLGWIPYITIWWIIIDMFRYSVKRTEEAGGNGPPDFVYVIIAGQAVVFSLFAGVQFFQQLTHTGCKYYWYGEIAYLMLSMVAKGLLGSVLLANILLLSTANVDEAFAS